jgi:hypothetical protein
VAAEREPLQRQQAVAEVEANNFRNAENKAIARVLADAKKPENGGIDYANDQAAREAVDRGTALRARRSGAAANASRCRRSTAQLTAWSRSSADGSRRRSEAVTRGAAEAEGCRTRRRAQRPRKPPTLRGLPNAAAATTGNDLATAMGRLKGAAFEAAYAKLTPAQQAALVDD